MSSWLRTSGKRTNLSRPLSWGRQNACPTLGSLSPSNLDDLIAQRAARHLDDGDVADLLAEQGLTARAASQDLVVVVILITGTDERVHFFLAVVEVLDSHAHAEHDGVARQRTLVDDVGAGQFVRD